MTFPEIVKTTLWNIIDEMSHSLSSFVKNPDKDFIRKRKLDFKKMMHLIISMESGSLNHELLKFFEYDSSVPTGSAFYQQRSKLSVSAFRHLLKEFNLKPQLVPDTINSGEPPEAYGCSKRDEKTIYGFFGIVHLKSVYNHAWNDQVQYDFG